jgi:membrane associated rhomboid family serine protease
MGFSRTPTEQKRVSLKNRTLILGVLVAALWILEALDRWILDESLDGYGIQPRVWSGLWGILFAPFLHGGFSHLLANTVPFLILGWFIMLHGITVFFEVTVLVMVLGGLGTWLIGASNTIHIGASGLVFGYFGFLLLRGCFERSVGSILIAALVGSLYGGLLWGIFPTQPGVSWEGHLCGFVGGATSAWLIVRYGDEVDRNTR